MLDKENETQNIELNMAEHRKAGKFFAYVTNKRYIYN